MILPTDSDLAALAVDAERLAPAGEVYDAGEDRAVITRLAAVSVVSICGTRNRAGWYSDFKIMPVIHPILGPLESGFADGVAALYPVLRPKFGSLPVIVQGFSRGAGMVPIVAGYMVIDRAPRPIYCHTWEAPWAVGLICGKFLAAAGVEGRATINGNDPVPDVPNVPWLIQSVWPITRIGSAMRDPFDCHNIALIAAEMVALA